MKTKTGIATLAVAVTLIASTVAQANVHAKNIMSMVNDRVSTAYWGVKNAQEQLQEYYHANNTVPGVSDMAQNVAGLKYITSIANDADGKIVATFSASDPVLSGKVITLTPAEANSVKDYTNLSCTTTVDLANYGLTAAAVGDKVLSGSLFDEFDCTHVAAG